MSAATSIARSSRARPCRIELPDRTTVVVPPPSLDQIVACLLLDPAPGYIESPLEERTRLREQAHILLGPVHAHLTGRLDQWQIAVLAGALYLAANGMDAESFAAWELAQREANRHLTAMQAIEQLERRSSELAAALKILPAEVGAQPLADVMSLEENLRKERQAEARFHAALHDKTLV